MIDAEYMRKMTRKSIEDINNLEGEERKEELRKLRISLCVMARLTLIDQELSKELVEMVDNNGA